MFLSRLFDASQRQTLRRLKPEPNIVYVSRFRGSFSYRAVARYSAEAEIVQSSLIL